MTDALDREVVIYDYAMPGERIHQASMEAGERWMLDDVTGKTIRSWDSRGHNFRTDLRCAAPATRLYRARHRSGQLRSAHPGRRGPATR